jgi:alpha-tubulin suppressor-like RCC1 family protein
MKILRDILLIIGIFACLSYTPQLLQISAGVVQSQNVEAPPVANDALVAWGNSAGNGLFPDDTIGLFNLSTDTDWDTVVCGAFHCLAIKGGALYVWGTSGSGALGLNTGTSTTDTSLYITTAPTQIGSDTDWTCIAAGAGHSLGIRAGRLYTWGINAQGQLGQGNTTSLGLPTQVGSDTDWSWCSAGSNWSAAVKGGQLLTCGQNSNFRTGLNTSTGNTTSFTVADLTSTWTIVSCGDVHGLGIRTDSLYSWGSNTNGRTGQGTTSGSTQVPTQIGTLTGWTEIAAGNLHSLSIRNDTLYTFGSQQFGRLANGNLGAGNVTSPQLIGSGYSDISCSAILVSYAGASYQPAFSFAIRNDSLFGTGANSRRQLGITTANKAVATFTLIDSVNFNYKKVAAHGGGGIAIRGN